MDAVSNWLSSDVVRKIALFANNIRTTPERHPNKGRLKLLFFQVL